MMLDPRYHGYTKDANFVKQVEDGLANNSSEIKILKEGRSYLTPLSPFHLMKL